MQRGSTMAKPTITWIIIFATSWLLVGCGSPEVTAITASQGLSLEIPRAEQPILDGIISPREWSGAYQTELSGGGELLLITADGYLFLGIRGKPEPVISICLDRGREVAILHSSAAIGTAIYKQGENTWDQVQGFTWSNRFTTNSPEAQSAREANLKRDGWAASTGRMGTPEDVEYQIAIPAGFLRLAVSAIGAPDYEEVAIWPADAADDCGNIQFLGGPIPESAQFSPEDWMTVTASP
jgi:hypothetical protein